MRRNYHTIRRVGKSQERELAEFLTRNGQGLLPMVELIQQSRLAVDELIDVAGRAAIEAVLQLTAPFGCHARSPPQDASVLDTFSHDLLRRFLLPIVN